MNYDISIQEILLEEDEKADVINARELHTALEVRTRFNRWIDRRILGNGYIEGIDYWVDDDEPRSIDYLITVDMAQELAILERNNLSRSVRDFVIDARNKNQDFLQGENYVQEILIQNLKKEVKCVQANHLKCLISKYSEIHDLDIIDGCIKFFTLFNSQYDLPNLSAGVKFDSDFYLKRAINLAEELIGTEESKVNSL